MKNPLDLGYYHSEELLDFGFKAVGANVRIAKNCTVVGARQIEIGDNVRVDGYTTIVATAGRVVIGSYIHIGGGCHLGAAEDLMMEDFSGLSQGVRIYTATDDYSGRHMTNPMVPEAYLGVTRGAVRLGRHVIIGSGSVVLPGASIGEGSAVGALSLVTKTLEGWGVYSGIPARRLKARSQRLLELETDLKAKVQDETKGIR